MAAVFFLVFLKNAWVSEDAYITFRSVEQLFAGNGLRWNIHERVQAFTHPLWFAVLASLRVFVSDLYVASILASFVFCAVALERLYRATGSIERWIFCVTVLLMSRSFFDFTTSGLEGPLSFALLGTFFWMYFSWQRDPDAKAMFWLSLVVSGLLLTRHDHAVLIFIPLVAFFLSAWPHVGSRLIGSVLLGALPFLIWTGFSLLYYGSPIPNPAWAKLGTGIPPEFLVGQGEAYLWATSEFDPALPVVLALSGVAGLIGLFAKDDRSEGRARFFVALGLLAQVLYVVRIGGDFMVGRFLAPSFFVAVLLIGRSVPRPSIAWKAGLAALLVVTLTLPNAPLRTGLNYQNADFNRSGVVDERGLFFEYTSLWRWWNRDPEKPFPDHRWTRDAQALSASPQRVYQRANVGFFGYWIGTDKIVIDPLALTDPLLSRLPTTGFWRIGHFSRTLPAGYLDTLRSGQPMIEDEEIRRLHAQVQLATEADLLADGRLQAIYQLNFGETRKSNEGPAMDSQ